MRQILIKPKQLKDSKLSVDELYAKFLKLPLQKREKEHSRFRDIKRRCYDPKNKDYPYYGAKGIKVCDEWLNNSKNYYAFAYLNYCYINGMSIDRIDPKGNYSPKNCRFIDKTTNCTINFINQDCKNPPLFRQYRDFGGLYESQYIIRAFGDVNAGFCRHRRSGGYSVYESLKVPANMQRDEFWALIKAKKLKFDNEVFINKDDKTAIYPNQKSHTLCPKCEKMGLILDLKAKFAYIHCKECDFLHFLQTKEGKK